MQGPLFKGLPIFFVVLFALFRSSNTFAIVPINRRIEIKNNNDKIVLCALKKEKVEGVYARPSAAIERGSGFYIPGLEVSGSLPLQVWCCWKGESPKLLFCYIVFLLGFSC